MSSVAVMSAYIAPHDRVLDCGCGDGALLQALYQHRAISGYGIDLNADNITTCIKKGLSVFHGDMMEGIKAMPNQCMDVVILSKTLQQVQDPIAVIHALCRVGKKVIVTFPNFAHWRCRWQLLKGHIPQSAALPYSWHNTPNIRVISIRSFQAICDEEGLQVCDQSMIRNGQAVSGLWPNMRAEEALFVIKKEGV